MKRRAFLTGLLAAAAAPLMKLDGLAVGEPSLIGGNFRSYGGFIAGEVPCETVTVTIDAFSIDAMTMFISHAMWKALKKHPLIQTPELVRVEQIDA